MMRFLPFVMAFAMQATAVTTTINVGQNGLTFTPDTVTAAVGDILEFKFFPGDHSAGTADFDKPCVPSASGGFFSGFMADSSKLFLVNVTSTDPMFIYCSQVGHCGAGMVMAVNPTSAQTLAAFRSAAQGQQATPGKNVFGGTVVSASSVTTSGSAPAQTTAPSGNGNGNGNTGGGPYGGPSTPGKNVASGLRAVPVAFVLGAAGFVAFLMH